MIKSLENILSPLREVNRKVVIEARTATATGATTGTISATTTHVVPTSGNAAHIFILPSMSVGQKIVIEGTADNNYVLKVPTGYSVNGSAATTSSTMTKTCKVTATCYAKGAIQVTSEVIATGAVTLPTFA